jgi:hypothetical protein
MVKQQFFFMPWFFQNFHNGPATTFSFGRVNQNLFCWIRFIRFKITSKKHHATVVNFLRARRGRHIESQRRTYQYRQLQHIIIRQAVTFLFATDNRSAKGIIIASVQTSLLVQP